MTTTPRPSSSRLLRVLRHRLLEGGDAGRRLGAATLGQIEARVGASERRHSGQIRVSVEAGLPLSYLWRDATARARALALFGKLRVWDTERNNGVLIYLLLAERAIEIVADRGLADRVDPTHWQRITATMAAEFGAGRFEDGLNQAIDAVDALLVTHFPRPPGASAPNELPDAPYLG